MHSVQRRRATGTVPIYGDCGHGAISLAGSGRAPNGQKLRATCMFAAPLKGVTKLVI